MSETSNAPSATSAFNAPNDAAEVDASVEVANNAGAEVPAVAPPSAEGPSPEGPSVAPPSPEDSSPEAAPETAPAEQPVAARLTHGLEVEVRFQLGEVVMPLSALANLKPEQVLTELDGVHFPKVKAVSAGRAFAEGELVRVGDEIGFRVTKVYP